MTFEFDTALAASNNSDNAKLREATRMATLAYGLHVLGHDARITYPGPILRRSPRWSYFQHLAGSPAGGLKVLPAEALSSGHRNCDVAVKCSVGTKNDDVFLEHCRVLVAHEAANPDDPRVLNVPFLIHDDMVIEMLQRDLFAAYLDDDVAKVRAAFDRQPKGWVGLRGTGWPHRTAFLEAAPPWVDREFHRMGQPPMSAWDHSEWLCGFRAALALPGDTPKTNLTPLLALLGVPIVSYQIEHNTPRLDDGSMILFGGWDALWATLNDPARLSEIEAEATAKYRAGWSPIGQARQIVRMLEE